MAQRQDRAADEFEMRIPAQATELHRVRQALARWLDRRGAPSEVGAEVALAVHEAAANAVEHAYGPVDAAFDVEAFASPEREVCLIIRDQGRWRPPRGHNRGRGTLLMQELMDHFEVNTSEEGTVVRMRRRVARAGAPV